MIVIKLSNAKPWRQRFRPVRETKTVTRKEIKMIQTTASFKDNLELLPSIDGLVRMDIIDPMGNIIASIENQPGKKGSLAVYQYLEQNFGIINAEAAAHGLDVFAEHTADAKNRPGAHPNIDLLLEVVDGAVPLSIRIVST
jgi:hypothetical protein